MKINTPNQNFINPYTSAAARQKAASQPPQETRASEEPVTDSINLSSTTRDLQKIAMAMDNPQTDREQRIQDLKQQVQTDRYTVNAEAVAEKMIGSIIDGLG